MIRPLVQFFLCLLFSALSLPAAIVQAAEEAEHTENQTHQKEVTIDAPDEVTQGSRFDVSWSESLNSGDYIGLVSEGAAEGRPRTRIMVRSKSTGHLTAPAKPGRYEVRYVLGQGNKTMASQLIEVIEADAIEITAPKQVISDKRFDVSWSENLNTGDYIGIVQEGAAESRPRTRLMVRNKRTDHLTAPAEPGQYEIRYVLARGSKTMASIPIEVVASETDLDASSPASQEEPPREKATDNSADDDKKNDADKRGKKDALAADIILPKQVTQGQEMDVSWSGDVARTDHMVMFLAEDEDREIVRSARLGDRDEITEFAPSTPGVYEVWIYRPREKQTLGRATFEVTGMDIDISAPDKVAQGEVFEVSWSETINRRDYIAAIPEGGKDTITGGHQHTAQRVGDAGHIEIMAPSEPGNYELRYLLHYDNKAVSTRPLEVTKVAVQISAPRQVMQGEQFNVSWSEPNDELDRVFIVPEDASENIRVANFAFPVRDNTRTTLTAPPRTGQHEVRYTLPSGKPLARAPVEVVEADITLSAPDTIRVGERFTLKWNKTLHESDRLVLVRAGDDVDESQGYSTLTRNLSRGDVDEAEFPALKRPGEYEIRYQLYEHETVVARKKLTVLEAD